jgi:hypothetical protein
VPTEAQESTALADFVSGSKHALSKFRVGQIKREEVEQIVQRPYLRNLQPPFPKRSQSELA